MEIRRCSSAAEQGSHKIRGDDRPPENVNVSRAVLFCSSHGNASKRSAPHAIGHDFGHVYMRRSRWAVTPLAKRHLSPRLLLRTSIESNRPLIACLAVDAEPPDVARVRGQKEWSEVYRERRV